MQLKIWGCRGSVPTPGPSTVEAGGNTSCVEVTLDVGSTLVLDAGTGIRELGDVLLDVACAGSRSC
jgi:phosphoribosyl 1,2-cyclic phosphodiesterase